MPRVEALEERRLLTGNAEIRLYDVTDVIDVPSGTGAVNLGTLPAGSSTTRTISIYNDGTDDLTLGSLSLPPEATVTMPFTSVVAPASFTSFTFQFTAGAPGLFSGGMTLRNDDADEDPYSIQLTATVDAPPPAAELDVLDAAGNPLESCLGEVNFGSASVGVPLGRSFTIQNSGTADLTVLSVMVPSGFTVASPLSLPISVAPGDTATLTVQADTTSAGSLSGAIWINSNDSNESPFRIDVSATVTDGSGSGPEIEVKRESGATLASGETLNFGSTPLTHSVSQSITIDNLGTTDLLLDLTTLVLPTGFTTVTPFDATVAPGDQTILDIALNAATAGSYSGTLSFSTNDADEGSFSFTVSGTVNANEAPTASDMGEVEVPFDDEGVILDLWGVFSDVEDGPDLDYSVSPASSGGISAKIEDGFLTLKAAPGATGPVTFTITAVDSQGLSGTTTMTAVLSKPKISIIDIQHTGETAPAGFFVLQREGGDLSQPLPINFSVTGGTDFTIGGDAGFAADARTMTVTITPVDDTVVESRETLEFSLGNPATGDPFYEPGDLRQDSIYLYDDDAGAVVFISHVKNTFVGATGDDQGSFTLQAIGKLPLYEHFWNESYSAVQEYQAAGNTIPPVGGYYYQFNDGSMGALSTIDRSTHQVRYRIDGPTSAATSDATATLGAGGNVTITIPPPSTGEADQTATISLLDDTLNSRYFKITDNGAYMLGSGLVGGYTVGSLGSSKVMIASDKCSCNANADDMQQRLAEDEEEELADDEKKQASVELKRTLVENEPGKNGKFYVSWKFTLDKQYDMNTPLVIIQKVHATASVTGCLVDRGREVARPLVEKTYFEVIGFIQNGRTEISEENRGYDEHIQRIELPRLLRHSNPTTKDDIWAFKQQEKNTCGTITYDAEVRAFELTTDFLKKLKTDVSGRNRVWSPVRNVPLPGLSGTLPIGSGELVGTEVPTKVPFWSRPIAKESGGEQKVKVVWKCDGAPDNPVTITIATKQS